MENTRVFSEGWLAVRSPLVGWGLALCLVAFGGCTPGTPAAKSPGGATSEVEHGHEHGADEHDDEHAAPKSLADAVAQAKELDRQIADAYTAGKPDDAHDAMHEIGHLFEAMGPLIDTATLSSTQVSEARAAREKLFDLFNQLDEGMHGGTVVSYADLQSEIEAGFTQLTGLASASASTP